MTELSVGLDVPGWSVPRVSEEKMKTMAALLRDPNPIHLDPQACVALGLGDRVVNQGPINVGYVMNMLIAWAGDAAAVKRVTVRFDGQVHGGDALVAGGTVTDLRDTGTHRVATCSVWLRRTPDQDVVMHGTADVAFPLVGAAAPGGVG